MKDVIVLAMHGAPPTDFPRQETAELFMLHGQLEAAPPARRAALAGRYAELDAKVRAWPRTAENDPFWAASMAMAEQLSNVTGTPVFVGFNEFCAPSLDQALNEAADSGAGSITVITPMMTRGGEHSEVDIPQAIERARERYPGVSFRYVWPFEMADIAQFLAEQLGKFEA
jgi:sirohydrochlorin cobaltochelatase